MVFQESKNNLGTKQNGMVKMILSFYDAKIVGEDHKLNDWTAAGGKRIEVVDIAIFRLPAIQGMVQSDV